MTYSPDTILEFDGAEQSIAEHALDFGIPAARIVQRLAAGWTVEQAITRPVNVLQRERRQKANVSEISSHARRYTHDGKSLTLREWSAALLISDRALASRLARGLPADQVFSSARRHSAGALDRKHCRRTRLIEHDGQTHTVPEWSRRTGIKKDTITSRLRLGWSVSEALTLEPRLMPKSSRRREEGDQ